MIIYKKDIRNAILDYMLDDTTYNKYIDDFKNCRVIRLRYKVNFLIYNDDYMVEFTYRDNSISTIFISSIFHENVIKCKEDSIMFFLAIENIVSSCFENYERTPQIDIKNHYRLGDEDLYIHDRISSKQNLIINI